VDALRHLDDMAADLLRRIPRELGPHFEGRALPRHVDFGGYSTWTVEVRRRGELEAVVTMDWSQDIDPRHCRISIADAEESPVALVATGALAAGGALMGSLLAPGPGPGFALSGAAIGLTTALALRRVAAWVHPPRRSDIVSALQALSRGSAAALLPA
jgi:hypothetical protein